jgi:predicted DNA-binding protein (MmcQ/YjbR family)
MPAESKPMQALRKIALGLPGAEEGTSCNKAAFKVRKTAFMFMGMDEDSYNVMIKLRESLPEAAKLEGKEAERYRLGGHGWVKIVFPHKESPPRGLMARWIDESHRLLVPRRAK